MKLTNLR